MKLLECLENEAFNELINFSFGEVRNLFNWYAYYVPTSKAEPFVSEASAVKIKYEEELARIEKYTNEEYADLINSDVDIPEYDEPSFMVKDVELQTKSQLIGLIRKYFDRGVFEQNRSELYGQVIFKEDTIETPHELWVSLNVHKDHIYSILSILGYYQRHNNYFLSQSDFYQICYDLNRFLKAQEMMYSWALKEMKNGKKQTHWMWFIFPQLKALGHSRTALYYGIENLDEAKWYLAHPVLGTRLKEISEVLLSLETNDPYKVILCLTRSRKTLVIALLTGTDGSACPHM